MAGNEQLAAVIASVAITDTTEQAMPPLPEGPDYHEVGPNVEQLRAATAHQAELFDIVSKYRDIFAAEGRALGTTSRSNTRFQRATLRRFAAHPIATALNATALLNKKLTSLRNVALSSARRARGLHRLFSYSTEAQWLNAAVHRLPRPQCRDNERQFSADKTGRPH